ncbi:hypothetical protein [uncultured Duncaniella sp.]|uniref:hypothetical protein n=1 Tax=uncultured Duncaniella sp. TaxID=2768039 RepID=UPI00260330F2|nr:hypothetical protein [uncultured Duncaniella sp.]
MELLAADGTAELGRIIGIHDQAAGAGVAVLVGALGDQGIGLTDPHVQGLHVVLQKRDLLGCQGLGVLGLGTVHETITIAIVLGLLIGIHMLYLLIKFGLLSIITGYRQIGDSMLGSQL